MKKLLISHMSILATLSIIVAIGLSFLVSINSPKNQEYTTDTVYIYKYRELTEWELFTMAVIEVESEYDTSAYNIKSGATGILQITAPYVEEYNRITYSDIDVLQVYDPEISLQMWEAINDYYNMGGDFERAIYIHNPKAGAWYRTRIFNKMDDLKRQEFIRKKVTEICYGR